VRAAVRSIDGQVVVTSDGTRNGPVSTFARIHDSGGGWMVCEWLIAWGEVPVTSFERRLRRLRGFNPEIPRRSAMHAAYRRKTRRR
jgi:hypothetical protein